MTMTTSLKPVHTETDILPAWRGTPVAELLALHNLGAGARSYAHPQILIATCPEQQLALRIPAGFAISLHTAAANLKRDPFKVSWAIGIGRVSAIAIVGLGTPTITLANTIVEGDCNDDDLISSDGNIESPGTTCFLTTMAGDQLSVAAADLKLAGLTDNGGFTPTRLPLPGSVAIDVAATETACLANDQRGVLRPQDGDAVPEALCDVGAVELAPGEGIEIFADDFETGDTDRWQSLFPPPVR